MKKEAQISSEHHQHHVLSAVNDGLYCQGCKVTFTNLADRTPWLRIYFGDWHKVYIVVIYNRENYRHRIQYTDIHTFGENPTTGRELCTQILDVGEVFDIEVTCSQPRIGKGIELSQDDIPSWQYRLITFREVMVFGKKLD